MSEIGKLQRPEPAAPELAQPDELPATALHDPQAERQRTGDELAYRASGGRDGIAPMQRLTEERRAVGARLAGRLQRKADGNAVGPATVPQGGGSPLSPQHRQRFEPKLGADLSDVRVHTDAGSARAAADFGARAFTVGTDVHFNAGEFTPGSKEGDRLIAHELTHVVQGKKAGVQRKAEAERGDAGADALDSGAGHDVSHPDEPAEKEADSVADGIAESLHAGDAGGDAKQQSHQKGRAPTREHGGPAATSNSHDGRRSQDGAADARETPAPISAKYIGIGRKIFRAKRPDASSGGGSPSLSPTPGPEAKPSLKIEAKTDSKADPPAPTAASRDAGAWTAYDQNWTGAFVPKLKENGVAETTIAGLVGKKSSWFEDAYNAVESGKDYQPVVDRIFAEIPKEPAGQERHFWSGGGPAQNMADQAIKDKGKMPAGAAGSSGAAGGAAPQKAMRLETSHVGILFNGVFNQPPSKLDWAKQAIKFWQRASTNYAKATTGAVTAHLNVDFKYAKDQKVNREAIFGKFELPEIVQNMKTRSPDGKSVVGSLILDLWVHGATKDAKGKDKNVDKKVQFTVGANPAINEQQILDAIDAQIQVAVNT